MNLNTLVGKTFQRNDHKGHALVIRHFVYWRHDVPPYYDDEDVDYFTIKDEQGTIKDIPCSTFFNNYIVDRQLLV